MRITESRLRRVIKNIITEHTRTVMVVDEHGVKATKIYPFPPGSTEFDLNITLTDMENAKYAKAAIELQEGLVVSENGNTIVAKFPMLLQNKKSQDSILVAGNIVYFVRAKRLG